MLWITAMLGCGTVDAPRPDPAAPPPPPREVDWTRAYDFDGDGQNDQVEVSFSGGAHCCYALSLRLSRSHATHDLPFQLDGGYVDGLDESAPDRFDVRDVDGDGRPEIVAVIDTYNGLPSPIEPEVSARWGFRTNRVVVDVRGDEVVIRDAGRDGGDAAR